jgi:hypothetical protein
MVASSQIAKVFHLCLGQDLVQIWWHLHQWSRYWTFACVSTDKINTNGQGFAPFPVPALIKAKPSHSSLFDCLTKARNRQNPYLLLMMEDTNWFQTFACVHADQHLPRLL